MVWLDATCDSPGLTSLQPMADEFVRPAGTGTALAPFVQNDDSSYVVHVYGKEAGVAGSYTVPSRLADVDIKVTTAGDHLALVLSPTGALSVYKNKRLLFTREEALADVRSLTFVDLPEAAVFADDALSSSSFLTRHLAQLKVGSRRACERPFSDSSLTVPLALQHTPDYLLRFAGQFFSSTSDVIAPHATHNGALHRDAFGLRKVIVAATESGAVFGLDSLDGSILWTYLWPSIGLHPREPTARIEGTWLIKPATPGQAPTVAVLATEVLEGVSDVTRAHDGLPGV